MVKQIGVEYVSSIKGQSYTVEPVSLGINPRAMHETKASIMNRLMDGKSKNISKLDEMKKVGLNGGNLVGGSMVGGSMSSYHQQNRAFADIEAMRTHRKVIPFTGGVNSPFLNFSSGRSTKTENKQRKLDPVMGEVLVNIDTGFNRY